MTVIHQGGRLDAGITLLPTQPILPTGGRTSVPINSGAVWELLSNSEANTSSLLIYENHNYH